MSDGGSSPADFLRLWLDAQGEGFGDAAHGFAWDRAEALYKAWTALLDQFGQTAASSASPFDPSEWLKPFDAHGMTLMAEALGAPAGPREGVREWRAWSTALGRHRAITGAAWLAAFREFAERSRRMKADAERTGRDAPGLDAIAALWQEIADAEFARTLTSPDYLDAQTALLAAGLDLRRRARRRIEEMAEVAGLPTRREIDDMLERIHALGGGER